MIFAIIGAIIAVTLATLFGFVAGFFWVLKPIAEGFQKGMNR